MTETPEDADERAGRFADELVAAFCAGGDAPAGDGPDAPDAGDGIVADGILADVARRLAGAGLPAGDDVRAILEELGADGADVPPALPPDFELLGEIGRGGMGVVYRARQRSLDRLVAVKLLRPGLAVSPSALRRLQGEARTLAKLRHRHIVAVHEVGDADGRLFFTMDLVEGTSLDAALRTGSVTPAMAVRVLRQVASAVAYVHSHGLVHRDLKPANILIDRAGDAVVSDFGLATEASSTERFTLTGQVPGTPAYMSPEQARGDAAAVGEATDVWAMGVVLYECLTGMRPFEGPSQAELAYAVIHAQPRPPRDIDSRIPADLEAVCLKAIEKRPADRYPTARAFLDDLERFETGVPVRAQPPSRWRRFGRAVARHRRSMIVAAVAALVGSLVAGGAVKVGMRTDVQDLVSIGDELSARGQPGAAYVVYGRAARVAGADGDDGAERAEELGRKARNACVAEAQRLLREGRAREALEIVEQALREGEAAAMEPQALSPPRSWPGLSALRWERACAVEADFEARVRMFRAALHVMQTESLAAWSAAPREQPSPRDTWERRYHEIVARHVTDLRTSPTHTFDAASAALAALIRGLMTASDERCIRALDAGGITVLPALLRATFGCADDAYGQAQQVRRTARAAAARDLRATEQALADCADDPRLPDKARRAAVALLAEIADLPVPWSSLWEASPDSTCREDDVARVLGVWREVKDLSRAESLRRRVAFASELAATLASRGEPRFRFEVLILGAWLRDHTGMAADGAAAEALASATAAFVRDHGAEDPRLWFTRALGLAALPTAADVPRLAARAKTRPTTQAWTRHLISLTIAPEDPAPMSDDDLERFASGSAGKPAEAVRLRSARLAFDGRRWDVVPGSELLQLLGPDDTATLRYEGAWDGAASVTYGFHTPGGSAPDGGGRSGAVAPRTTLDLQIKYVPRGLGGDLLLTQLRAEERATGWSRAASASGYRAPSGRVWSPLMLVGSEDFAGPLRKELVLVVAEPFTAPRTPWTIDEWRLRCVADAAAIRAEADAADRAGDPEDRRWAVRGIRGLDSLLHVASMIPLPEARADLARIGASSVPRSESDWVDAWMKAARRMAGDRAGLGPGLDPPGEYDQTRERYAQHWLLLRLTATDPEMLAWTDRVAAEVSLPDPLRRDLAQAIADGRTTAPPTLVERGDDLSAPGPLWWQAVCTSPPSALLPSAWIVAATAAFAAAAVAIRRRRAATLPGAVLVAVGVLVDVIDLCYADVDAAPTGVGHLLAAAGSALMARTVGRHAWIAAACFASAAAACFVGRIDVEEASAPVRAGYTFVIGVAIALLPAIAADLRRHPFRRFEPPSRVRVVVVPLVAAFAVWSISFLRDRDGPATKLATVTLIVTFVLNALVPLVLARPPRHPSLWPKRFPPLFLILWGVPQIVFPILSMLLALVSGPVTFELSPTVAKAIVAGMVAGLGWALVTLFDAAWRHVPAPHAGRKSASSS